MEQQGDARPRERGPGAAIFDILNRVLDFLLNKFKDLPTPLKAVAYFVFLAFFCATVWRVTFGEYVVRGVVWDGDRFAESVEIRLRGDYFSTNSKGMYYAVLSPAQYWRFVAMGENDLPVMRRQTDGTFVRVKGPFEVKLSFWDDEFTDIDLAAVLTPRLQSKHKVFSFFIGGPLYAQPRRNTHPVFPSSGDRLVLERIILGRGAAGWREVEFELDFGAIERPLLLQGIDAGTLPMKQTVTFGEKYYFDVPATARGQEVEIEMDNKSSFFGRDEEFVLRVPLQYQTSVPVTGSKGTVLVVRLVPRSVGGR